MTPDESLAELGARIASMDERRADLSMEAKRLHAELVELLVRVMKLRTQESVMEDKSASVSTTQCRSCCCLMIAAAAASIFRLSFLPLRGQKADRHKTTKLAERIGPLCDGCLERLKDLADADVH